MVEVRVAATGVCHSDLSVRDGTIPQRVPAILGHEGAGIVTARGPGVTHLDVGDHVVLSWVVPCRQCAFCLGGQVELCEHGIDHHFGAPHGTVHGDAVFAAFGTGTFAESTVVPAGGAIRIDPGFPRVLAALIGCAVVTGVGAVVNVARIAAGDTVAVVGCGGIGLSAIQGARLVGASRIVAVDRVDAKLELALANGATDAVSANDDPVAAVHRMTGGRGVDHAVEAVGSARTIAVAYAMARRGGTVTVVGAGAFDDPWSIPAMHAMVDAKRVQGCVFGGTDPARDIPRMVALAQRGALDLERLVSRRIALEQADEAFAAMVTGQTARSLIVFDR
jgi:S-(hydroxymethyl)glutathione dehydrogenase/alcohol dehydrogenase